MSSPQCVRKGACTPHKFQVGPALGVVAPAKPRASPAAVGASQLLDGTLMELLVQHRQASRGGGGDSEGSWVPRLCIQWGWWVLTLLAGSPSQDEGARLGKGERSPGKMQECCVVAMGVGVGCWEVRLS